MMSAMTDRPNIPVPDELAATREEIRRLTAREEVLKGLLRDNPDLRTGADWIAEIKTVTQTRTDLKELRACHPALVDEFTFPTEVTRVVLSGIDADTGEIVSARKLRTNEKAA